MATLQIENLPDELYKRIQSLAAENNFTVNEDDGFAPMRTRYKRLHQNCRSINLKSRSVI